MAHREFVDAGVQWQAWDVMPSAPERRNAGERRAVLRDPGERRNRHEPRIRLDGYETGWLVFESANEKRRIHPIPPDWAQQTDEKLIALCRTAQTVPRHTSS